MTSMTILSLSLGVIEVWAEKQLRFKEINDDALIRILWMTK